MGGRPYRDIETCMDFVAKQLPYADVERAVCLGGSYGGYLALWIAGQPLADRKSTRLNSSHSGESRMPSSA